MEAMTFHWYDAFEIKTIDLETRIQQWTIAMSDLPVLIDVSDLYRNI